MSKSNENKGFGYITGCVLACVVLSILYASFVIGEAIGGLSIGIAATVAAAFGCAAVLVALTDHSVILEMRGLRADREILHGLCQFINNLDYAVKADNTKLVEVGISDYFHLTGKAFNVLSTGSK